MGESGKMEPEFFQTIEEHFRRLQGAPLVLSPSDWHLAAEWWERRVPLAVVLRALDAVLEKASRDRRGPIRSLAYCRYAVESEFAHHLELSLGQGEPGGRPGPGAASALERLRAKAARLERLAGDCAGDTRVALESAVRDLRAALNALATGAASPPQVEEELVHVEEQVTTALLEGLAPDDRQALEDHCNQRLARYRKQMSPEVRDLTHRRCLETEIRRRCRLPRLSLLAD